MDDIIFGINLQILSVNVSSEMKNEFEMSMLGELTFLLGLQVYQLYKGIFNLKPSISKTCLRSLGWKNPSMLVLL